MVIAGDIGTTATGALTGVTRTAPRGRGARSCYRCFIIDARLPVETVIRRLQAQAARHGDLLAGLLPPVQNFEALLRAGSREKNRSAVYLMTRSSLCRRTARASPASEGHETGYQARTNVDQSCLRQWAHCRDNAQRLGLEQMLSTPWRRFLITASYRLGLPQRLRKPYSARGGWRRARLHAIIGNFIARLGYANIGGPNARPAAFRKAVFSPATPRSTMLRLTSDEQPVHAASRYVYDWLVALYTTANENAGYHPQDVADVDRRN